jgi:hypothetical protein
MYFVKNQIIYITEITEHGAYKGVGLRYTPERVPKDGATSEG